MALPPGTMLGAYEVVALIGAGGMGEVYRARDRRLDRDVAVKILPESFAHDPERRVRFEREAKTLAALNQQHIGAIYGIEETSGSTALILELVEGLTLAERIERGRIPVDEALNIARQIAEALETAHEHGVIHRDLKPANVKVRDDGTVKVLDFGLAKPLVPSSGPQTDATISPTIASPAVTGIGIILGTAAYMSPEQAKGRSADKRSDLWAFGCVLYEMLTGVRAFPGEDVSDTLAAVLRAQPDWRRLPPGTPESIRRLVRRCLEKDRKRRLADAADARLEIDDAADLPAADVSPRPRRKRLLLTNAMWVAAVALVAALVTWGVVGSRRPTSGSVVRLSVNLEPGVHLGEASRELLSQQRPVLTAFALSPDGRQLAYVGHDSMTSQLYLRRLDQERAQAIAGTNGAQSPFFSPDGQEVGFFQGPSAFDGTNRDGEGAVIGTPIDARGAIRRVAATGGSVRTIDISGPAPRIVPFATWSADDTILLSGPDGIYRLPSRGGTIERLFEGCGRAMRFPELLPGGRSLLFNVFVPTSAVPSLAEIVVETLDTRERTLLVRGGSFARFAESGHLVFVRDGKLMAVPFDPSTRSTQGEPVVVGEDVMMSENGRGYFRQNGSAQLGMSRSGDLAFVTGGPYSETTDALLWVDRTGAAVPVPITPARMSALVISPDGKRIAWAQGPSNESALWVFEIERAVSRRLTGPGLYLSPIWSPDSARLASVTRSGDGSPVLAIVDVDRGTIPQNLPLDAVGYNAAHWASPDTIFLQRIVAALPGRLSTLTTTAGSKMTPLFDWTSTMQYPAFSPGGKFMSYSVNETGAYEVYVRPIPEGTPVTRVSTNGGSSSAWSDNGRELFYREGPKMMAVPISIESGFRVLGSPHELFSGDYIEASVPSRGFDVASGGRRFLMKARGPAAKSSAVTSINVVLNWFDELRRLVPTP